MIELTAAPLTADAFAPFGDVIEKRDDRLASMNDARFERYSDLADIDVGDSRKDINVSIARCRSVTTLPHVVDLVERHPLGSQAFVPLGTIRFLVVVGKPGETIAAADLRAFMTNGRQGINMRAGVWHMPLIGLEEGWEFLAIDRNGENNCDIRKLEPPALLTI